MKKVLSLVCIVACICCCFSATAQSDAYVKINGINGTSVATGLSAYTDILATGLVNTNCYTSGNSTTTCTGTPGNFNFQLYLSEVIPQLQARLFQSTVISTVDFVFRKPSGSSGSPFVYYQVHLEGVRVASITEVYGGGEVPTEQISLAFQKIAWKYTTQTSAGVAGTTTYGCYNSTGPSGTGTGSSCIGPYTFPF